MTSAVQKAIAESREREERLRDAMLDADNDPTEAAVARATLSDLCFEFRFREALAVAVEFILRQPCVCIVPPCPRCKTLFSIETISIEAILKGEK